MSVNREPFPVDRKEIYRYLGYRGHEADEATKELAEVCVNELLTVAEPKYVKREYPMKVLDDGTLNLGCLQTNSKNLMKNLGGCGRVLLMAVTLGLGVDRLLVRYGKLQVTKAVIFQAAAAAMIESYCNQLCLEWGSNMKNRDCICVPDTRRDTEIFLWIIRNRFWRNWMPAVRSGSR